MSATTPVLPGEDAEAFRQRVDAWTADLAPRNAVERFLVERAATDSWKIERADRVEAARLTAILRQTSAGPARTEMDEAEALGRRLIREDDDAAGGVRAGTGSRRSDRRKADHVGRARIGRRPEESPARSLDRLESTAAGCRWLRNKWAELRGILDRGDTWSNYDSGHGDLHAGAGARAGGRTRSGSTSCAQEPDPVGVEEHRLQLGRQLDETITSEGTRDRAVLRPIVDRAIARLDQLLAPHAERAAADAAELLRSARLRRRRRARSCCGGTSSAAAGRCTGRSTPC